MFFDLWITRYTYYSVYSFYSPLIGVVTFSLLSVFTACSFHLLFVLLLVTRWTDYSVATHFIHYSVYSLLACSFHLLFILLLITRSTDYSVATRFIYYSFNSILAASLLHVQIRSSR